MITTASKTTRAQLSVSKTITVDAPQDHAFAAFTQRMSSWWPLQSHHIGAAPAQSAVIEPRAGGRWFERAGDGGECDWGKVLVWEPPHRIVLSWNIGSDWKFDGTLQTVVEVRFIREGADRTKVELEHRDLEHYGEKAEMMRSIFDSDGGWSGILQRFVQTANER